MKLQSELNNVIEKLTVIKDRIPQYAEELKNNEGYNNFETRLAWDCLRAVMGTSTICDWYKKYDCNDMHITSLAKKALKAVYII
jgi:hypothetical protein